MAARTFTCMTCDNREAGEPVMAPVDADTSIGLRPLCAAVVDRFQTLRLRALRNQTARTRAGKGQ